MKIVFLCGSLEPGKDGVGDYCRKLAASLLQSDNSSVIVALNDKYLTADELNESQYDKSTEIIVTRFSQNLSWSLKIEKLRQIISNFDPDWISLQYVPYSFNKKGIPFYLPKTFEKINTKAKWHIMFHEIWIGMSNSSPFVHRIYGYFQKQIVSALVRKIKPRIVTTTNLLYQLALREKEINAERLPLFSNVSIYEQDENYISYLQKKYSFDLKADDNFRLGIFGTLYPEANLFKVVPAFINEKKINKTVIIIVFGKNNRPEELDKLKQKLSGSVVFIELGEISPSNVSNIFKLLNEAVLCTPVEYIGKSGAYAALRLHNIKVATLSSAPISKYENEIMEYNNCLSKRSSFKWDVEYIKDKFITLLSQS